MLNLYQLTTFVTVISEGSMTAAADKLFLTQPAVSQQIRNMEEELGVELLVRGVRQIKPTPQGEILFEHSRKILQLAQQAESTIQSMGAHLKGELKVGTLNSLGLHLMSPIISRLLRHNPDLMVKVEYHRGEELMSQFRQGDLDVVILPEVQTQFQASVESDVESRFVLKEEMWLAGAGSEAESHRQIDVSELSTVPFVTFSGEYPDFNQALDILLKEKNVRLKPVFESSNVGTLKRVIESGLGWGFLPAHSIRKQVRSGRLTRIHVNGFSYSMDLLFYHKKNPGAGLKMLIESFYQAMSQDRS